MRHVDEGILHAFLDGELPPAEVVELERHLSVCVPCRAQLAEARSFVGEADALVVALDPVGPKKSTRPAPAREASWRVRPATMAWAATVVLAVGLGYSLRPTTPVAEPPTPLARQDDAGPRLPALAAPQASTPGSPRAKAVDRPTEGPLGLAAGGQGAPVAATAEQASDLTVTPPFQAAVPTHIALVDGAPVDTTVRALGFGPSRAAAPRRITLEEAVTHLGGTIRLIDGLAPQRVELLSGVDVAGADPDREVVRVYYEEPDLGLVTLDQQRPGPSFASNDARQRRSEAAPVEIRVNPTTPSSAGRVMARAPIASSTIAWRSDGVWLALTSRLPGDRMTELRARVK